MYVYLVVFVCVYACATLKYGMAVSHKKIMDGHIPRNESSSVLPMEYTTTESELLIIVETL